MQMAHVLFHEAGLMETFQIPQRQFVNYFRALEANYGSNVCKSTRTCLIRLFIGEVGSLTKFHCMNIL